MSHAPYVIITRGMGSIKTTVPFDTCVVAACPLCLIHPIAGIPETAD